MAKKIQKLVLVTGSGRSGTLTMKHLLNKGAGLKVGHEVMGPDGTVSLFFISPRFRNYPYFPGEGGKSHHEEPLMKAYEFKRVLHQTRHPLKCIPSISMIIPRAILDWYEEMKVIQGPFENRLHKSMAVWAKCNAIVEEELDVDIRYKVEDMQKVWPKLVKLLDLPNRDGGYPYPDFVTPKHRATGSRNKVVTWKDLSSIDKDLTKEIRDMGRRYGYKD